MPLSGKHDSDAVKVAGQELVTRISSVMDAINWKSFLQLADLLPEYKRIFVTGAGRSGLVARMFGMRLMHAGLTAFIPGETITPAAGEGDLVVALSCTGTTGFTSYLTNRAKEFGAKVVVITTMPDSPLTKDADQIVTIPAKAEDIVLRAAVFEHVTSLCLDAVFNVLSERLKIDVAAFQAHHANLE